MRVVITATIPKYDLAYVSVPISVDKEELDNLEELLSKVGTANHFRLCVGENKYIFIPAELCRGLIVLLQVID
jgi:hypothetical protein